VAAVEGLREILIVFGAELRRAVKSGRVVVLLALYSMFSLLVLFVVGSIANAARRSVESQISAAGADSAAADRVYGEFRKNFLGWMFSDDSAMLEAMRHVPLVVLIVFKTALFFLPAYIAFMGFDQISGEVGPRSIRYLTVRARRSSVLFGKFTAQAVVLLGLVLFVDACIFIYAKVYNADFTTGDMIVALLKFWLASAVFSLAYLSLTTGCSALFRQPPVSLVFNFMLLFGFWMLDFIGGHFVPTNLPGLDKGDTPEPESPLAFIRFLSPSHYSTDLLHPHFTRFAVSGAAYAAFAAVFLGAAYLILRTRDV
jgi:ABC-2 type transport system permease protein